MFFPRRASSGLALANAASVPPAMIVSDPSRAPMAPPETGASRYSHPRCRIRSANVRVAVGEIELMSTNELPGREALGHARGSEQHLLDVRRVGEHRDHDLGAL